MRKVLFCGYDAVGSKGYVFGDLVHNLKILKDKDVPRVMVGGYEVYEDSIGQFTGLTDKNGTEIFEKDIIRFNDNYESEVMFENGSFVVEYLNNHILLSLVNDTIEVIGRKYDRR